MKSSKVSSRAASRTGESTLWRFWVFKNESMITALLVIAILVFLIVAHELGHFVVAKLFRVRVEEFGIGYPPRAFTLGKIGETEYTLNWIPFGGFVRLFGDVGKEERGRGSLVDAPRIVQAAILIAGVAMNTLGAWMLFTAAYHTGIPRVVEERVAGESVQLIVAQVVPGSPADAAGLKPGDEVLSIVDSQDVTLSEMSPTNFSDFVRTRGGKALTLTYLHEKETITTTITPAHAVIPDDAGRPAVGMALYMVSAQSLPWGDAAREGASALLNAFRVVGQGLWGIVERALAGDPSLAGVVGPIGLVGVVGNAAQSGFGNVLALAAFISVNLAIINLIPIPALDGGRLFLLGVETVLRREAPRLFLQMLNAVGVLLIIFLMITVTYNDIARLLG